LGALERAFLLVTASVTATFLQIDMSGVVGNFAESMLYVINFCGGCSGSCTGGIKIFRIVIVFLLIKSYFMRLIRTNAIYVPSYAGRRLTEIDVTSLFAYFLCYGVLAILLSLALSFFDMDFSRAVGAILTTMNNNGPFFGLHKATYLEIASLSSCAKGVLITAMVAGRVEFVIFFMVLMRPFWYR
jgi:trk system potassium uptake protein TrkH